MQTDALLPGGRRTRPFAKHFILQAALRRHDTLSRRILRQIRGSGLRSLRGLELGLGGCQLLHLRGERFQNPLKLLTIDTGVVPEQAVFYAAEERRSIQTILRLADLAAHVQTDSVGRLLIISVEGSGRVVAHPTFRTGAGGNHHHRAE